MKCAAFWKHTNIRKNTQVYPCCRFKKPIAAFDGNLDEVLHLDAYEKLRQQSLNNEPIPECSKCYYEESLGKKSLREKFNEDYNTDEVKLQFVEIGFDNICNLTCDACGPEFSHSWAKELGNLIPIQTIKEDFSPNQDLEKIVFLGGEPLMTNRHYTFLRKINDPSKVSVTYVTNGTFLLKDAEIDLLKQFKKISFIVSIDGYNSLNDKVRSRSKWVDILKFLDQIEQLEFNVSINTTIHINNWFGLDDLGKFIRSKNYDWTTNVVTYPTQFDIANSLDKDSIRSYFESIEFPNKEAVLEHLK